MADMDNDSGLRGPIKFADPDDILHSGGQAWPLLSLREHDRRCAFARVDIVQNATVTCKKELEYEGRVSKITVSLTDGFLKQARICYKSLCFWFLSFADTCPSTRFEVRCIDFFTCS